MNIHWRAHIFIQIIHTQNGTIWHILRSMSCALPLFTLFLSGTSILHLRLKETETKNILNRIYITAYSDQIYNIQHFES